MTIIVNDYIKADTNVSEVRFYLNLHFLEFNNFYLNIDETFSENKIQIIFAKSQLFLTPICDSF